MSNPNMRRTVKTADTVFDIIHKLQESDENTVTELLDSLDLAKSTVHTYLSTLEQKEYVVKKDSSYQLSLKFLDHGMHAMQDHALTSTARPILEQTATETGELVWLIVEEHGRAVYLERAKGDKAVQTSGRRGLRTYLHVLASGKCILANMDEEEVNRILDWHGLPAQTENTVTNREELFTELQRVREEGYAYNRDEEVSGIHAIGAPIIQGGDGTRGREYRWTGYTVPRRGLRLENVKSYYRSCKHHRA